MSTYQRLQQLLEKARNEVATPDELGELAAMLQADETGEITRMVMNFHPGHIMAAESDSKAGYDSTYWDTFADDILQLDKRLQPVQRVKTMRYTWWSVAALLLVMATGTVLLLNRGKLVKETVVQPYAAVAPGGNKAILTLSGGKQIVLDNTGNGNITQQNGIQIIKLDSGLLAYKGTPASATPEYNTLTTPRGGQFQLVLPDGSKVWLNAGSSITFPTAFTGKQRMVTMTGEAYFEITDNASMPFFVKTKELSVQVLGTSFNVNAYEDEPVVRTTLLTGAVKAGYRGELLMLQPGQQASIAHHTMQLVKDIDVEECIAWKNGVFSFNRADLPAVMRQIARWYDVEVSFEGNSAHREFWGKIARNSNLAEVLKVLELSNIHFRMEDKKIIILP